MPIKAVIFDWAGTVVDFGCRAPVEVLTAIFAEARVPLEGVEGRHAMGLLKRDQIREITRLPRVAEAWRQHYGALPDEAAVDRLFADFVPRQLDCVRRYSHVIEGVPQAVDELRRRGIRIGSSTGYTREMLDLILPQADAEGYAPDAHLTPTDVGNAGRPAPWMLFENMRRLAVYPPSACLKVGDTPSDIEEGLNAGMWTAGVILSSSETAAGGADYARERLQAAGAHFLIDMASDVVSLLERIT
ncbi:MAG: phosphonoacetaldehyde hydrolase [Bryobacteraceae bacterium]|nr:phosphonoacetaldehyde hydrolase [Bryobacteraceae bacterium]